MRWDIFCKVIDNHGDIGVCWRLAADLGQRGEAVRLWVDDPAALAWMAPAGAPGVVVQRWDTRQDADAPWPEPGEVLIEAFGCDPAAGFVSAFAQRARSRPGAWINLEYLSAERFAERAHGLPSPVMSGPGQGLVKHFFYPGFTPATGGLLREPGLAQRQAAFDKPAWLHSRGIADNGARRISLFCYEPPALRALLQQLAGAPSATQLLVTAGRASAALDAQMAALDTRVPDWNRRAMLSVTPLPLLDQAGFDALLWACDFNFVRGEDSLVRALWAGKPFAWQLYPQHDGAQFAKLEAFLDQLNAAPAWAQFMRGWNASQTGDLPTLDEAAWQPGAAAFRDRLLAQEDLASQLISFARKKR